MLINGKQKLAVIALSVILAITNSFTTTARAVTAKVVPTCVDPVLKYSGMRKLSQIQLYDLLRLTGFQGQSLKVAWAVAMEESHGNPLSHNFNPRTGDDSYGMFQVNLYGALKGRIKEYGLESAKDLTNPVINAHIAYRMSSMGKNWTPWHADPGERDYKLVRYWLKAIPLVPTTA